VQFEVKRLKVMVIEVEMFLVRIFAKKNEKNASIYVTVRTFM